MYVNDYNSKAYIKYTLRNQAKIVHTIDGSRFVSFV